MAMMGNIKIAPLLQTLLLTTAAYTSSFTLNHISRSKGSFSRQKSIADLNNAASPHYWHRHNGNPRYLSSSIRASNTFLQAVVVPKDILIIGGSLAGLSIALELATIEGADRPRHITVLDAQDPTNHRGLTEFGKTNVASMAAAGMLAPMSERLPSGPLLDLCLKSRGMYGDWVKKVETLAQGQLGAKYLWQQDPEIETDMKPWDIGYQCNGGFLAPAFAGDSVATWAPPQEGGDAMWLDQTQILEMEPNLNPEIVGGWWFPTDASVDARRLTCSLRAACANCGVELCYGENYAVTGIDQADSIQLKVLTASGVTYAPEKAIAASGAWMKNILPVPIVPHKGQSLSVTLEEGESIDRILFAQDTYIVPKADGRLIVGATVEPNTFDSEITPAGLTHIISNACELLPSISRGKIGEMWTGLRPTTPDKAPILGRTKHDQLFVAGGYWRNGVLLAPKTAQLVSDLVVAPENMTDSDEKLLESFNWNRFYDSNKAGQLAADIRYKSQLHAVQYRGKGSATAGVELGFYEGAKAAKSEREKDRSQLIRGISDDNDDAFERAAMLGQKDGSAFVLGKVRKGESNVEKASPSAFGLKQGDLFEVEEIDGDGPAGIEDDQIENDGPVGIEEDQSENELEPVESYDKHNAITVASSDYISKLTSQIDGGVEEFLGKLKLGVGSKEVTEGSTRKTTDLNAMYDAIKANKASRAVALDMPSPDEFRNDKEDLGFDIFWVDPDTEEHKLVPPYTSPGEFEQKISAEKSASPKNNEESATQSGPNEATFDGYTDIQMENSRGTRGEELEAMRAARISNRAMESTTFGSSLEGEADASVSSIDITEEPATEEAVHVDLDAMYAAIKANKASVASKLDMPSPNEFENDKEDLGFEIFWVDPDTEEYKLVPPYTSPGEFEQMITAAEETVKSKGTEVELPPKLPLQPDEATFDGYTDIQASNSRGSRQEELEAMRASRISNRSMESEMYGSGLDAN